MTHEPPAADQTISEIVDRLSVQFPDRPTATIREVVTQSYEEFNDARVRDFVEVLVEKQAKKRLKHLDS
ncbi:three-helix bundle dimerization domain-containing protein, partial [Microbacterium sp.]|uniref:three-helix bundle dimerization domain-containing protein n=1 Tax=Microbacterium sp. TaxID=51671 RepID=UPI002E3312DA